MCFHHCAEFSYMLDNIDVDARPDVKKVSTKEIKYFTENISQLSYRQTNFQEPEDDDFKES